MSEALYLPQAKPTLAVRFFNFPLIKIIIGTFLVLLPVPLITRLAHEFIAKPYNQIWPTLLACAVSFLVYRFFVLHIDKRPMSEFSRLGALREFALGVISGFGMQVALFGTLALTGVYQIKGINGPGIEMLTMLSTYFGVAMLEETIGRGIIFGVTEKALGSVPALIISALVFGLAHAMNDGVTIMGVIACTAFGAFLAAVYMATRRLWMCIGFHFAWNYCESQVFSTAVSGYKDGAGLVNAKLVGADLWTGGTFGVEGSLVAVVIAVLATTLFLVAARHRNQFKRSEKRLPASA